MSNKVWEMCPHCTTEVELEPKLIRQSCPNCGVDILPCASCNSDITSCLYCPAEKLPSRFSVAISENSPEYIITDTETNKRVWVKIYAFSEIIKIFDLLF
jgi:predicted RNA-binding Zn-ribbon protein involved in translation (DUF1610 family)